MQPTDNQVQRSLAALREPGSLDETLGRSGDPYGTHDELTTQQLPTGLVERIENAPAVRADRLAEARQRLATGEVPTANDLANRMVGRLVCDRLR